MASSPSILNYRLFRFEVRISWAENNNYAIFLKTREIQISSMMLLLNPGQSAVTVFFSLLHCILAICFFSVSLSAYRNCWVFITGFLEKKWVLQYVLHLLRSGKVVLYHLLRELGNGRGIRTHLEAPSYLFKCVFRRSPFATFIPCICGKVSLSKTAFCFKTKVMALSQRNLV